MDTDPLVVLANDLADEAATYKLLFRQALATLQRQQAYIAQMHERQQALRDEIQRYMAAMVGA